MQGIYSLDYKDRKVEYGIIGNGNKTIVLYPGASLASLLISLNTIKELFKIFLDKYKIYVFERPTPQSDGYTFDDFTDERIYALDKLNIKDAYVIGVSIGGMLALNISLINQKYFKKMLLVSTTSKTNEKRLEKIKHWESLSNKHEIKELAKCIYRNLFTEEFMPKEKIDKMASMYKANELDCDYFSRSLRTMYGFDIKDKIKKIKIETFVIGAKNDIVFYPESAIEIANELKCKYYIYDKYCHGVYDEADDYRKRVLDFFEGE